MIFRRSSLAHALALALLTGCSVAPERIESPQVVQSLNQDKQLIYQSQQPMSGPITLGEALARAVKYNLSHRTELMQEALASASYELVKMDMLPMLTLSAGRSHRDNISASSSRSILSGQESLEPSTSQDRLRNSGDIRFAWNALDFGVSYLQAKQEADRYQIAQLSRKQAMSELIQQVTDIYWRAVAMQQVGSSVEKLIQRTDTAQKRLETIQKQQLQPPLTTLQERRALIELSQQLEKMRQSINQSHIELAALMNERITTPLQFDAHAIRHTLPDPKALGEIQDLELVALLNSSDYSTELYNARIDQLESRKALLGLLPGLEFSYGVNYDSNSYLVNNQWNEAGIKVSWDILRLLALGDIDQQAEAQRDLGLMRRLATHMAVITQVHLAWQEYHNTLNNYQQAQTLNGINTTITTLTNQAKNSRATTEAQQIQSELYQLRSELGQLLTYAEAQSAFSKLFLTMGVNPVPDHYQSYSVAELGGYFNQLYRDWMGGATICCHRNSSGLPQIVLPEPPKPAPTTPPAAAIPATHKRVAEVRP